MNRRSVLGGIAAGLVGLFLGRNSAISQVDIDAARVAHGKCDLCHTLPNYVVKYHCPLWGVTEYSFQHFPEWEPRKAWPLPAMRVGDWSKTVNWYPLDCLKV